MLNFIQNAELEERTVSNITRWIKEDKYNTFRHTNQQHMGDFYDEDGNVVTRSKGITQGDAYRNENKRTAENEIKQFAMMEQFVNFEAFEAQVRGSIIKFYLKHDRDYDRNKTLVENIAYYQIKNYFNTVATEEQIKAVTDFEVKNKSENDELTLNELKEADRRFLLSKGIINEFFNNGSQEQDFIPQGASTMDTLKVKFNNIVVLSDSIDNPEAVVAIDRELKVMEKLYKDLGVEMDIENFVKQYKEETFSEVSEYQEVLIMKAINSKNKVEL